MPPNSEKDVTNYATSPLLGYYYNNSYTCDCGSNGDEPECEGSRWWWAEVKAQVAFSGPMIVTNFCYSFVAVVAVMFAGHLGGTELAASNLANSLASVSGFAFMIGLSGALETLCGQGYGAKLYENLGLYLQASCIISLIFSIIISILWFFSEPILILLRQDPEISKMTALYLKCLIPGLFAYGFLQNILRFLQTQSVVLPLVVFSVLPLVSQFVITYVLVYLTPLGFEGAPLAVSITMWFALFVLISFVVCSDKFEYTWNGFSFESFHFVLGNLKLALPSAAMICLEDGAFEILVLLSGLMPNSKITTSLVAMCVNTQAIAYMVAYGLSAATSTRVSNELGGGNPQRAKQAMAVSLMLSVFLGLIVVLGLGLGHNIWAGFFSQSPIIAKEFASLTPLLIISIAVDSIQAVLSGVARGCGWQQVTVYINWATFYCIGMPMALFLGFNLKLYAKGLWIGLICGLSCQACTLLLLTQRSKWNKLQLLESVEKENSVQC